MAAKKNDPKGGVPAEGNPAEGNPGGEVDVEKLKAELEAEKKAREAEAAELEELRKVKAQREAEAEEAKKKAEEEAKAKMTAAERVAEMEKKYAVLETKLTATQSVLDKRVQDEQVRETAEKVGIVDAIIEINPALSKESLMKCDRQFLNQLKTSLGVPESQAIDDTLKKLRDSREENINRLREERKKKNRY